MDGFTIGRCIHPIKICIHPIEGCIHPIQRCIHPIERCIAPHRKMEHFQQATLNLCLQVKIWSVRLPLNSTEVIVLKMPDSRCSPVEAADCLFSKIWEIPVEKGRMVAVTCGYKSHKINTYTSLSIVWLEANKVNRVRKKWRSTFGSTSLHITLYIDGEFLPLGMEGCCPQQVVRSIRLGVPKGKIRLNLLGSFAETHVLQWFLFDVFL